MSCELEILKRLRVYEEPAGESTFGVDNTTNLATAFLDVPAKAGSIKYAGPGNEAMQNPMLTSTRVDAHDVQIIGRNSSSLAFVMPLQSHGLGLDGTVAVPTVSDWGYLRILKAIFGASFATGVPSAQTTVQSGTTTTVINVTAGHGTSRWSVGDAIACRVVTGSLAIEMREVTATTANSVTVDQAFSAIPITGSVVYGAVSVHLAQSPDTSLQFVVEGTETDDRVGLLGMQLKSLKLSTPVDGSIPELTLDFMGTDGLRLGSASPGAVSLTYYSPVTSTVSELTLPTVASTTRVLVDQSSHSLELALAYDAQRVGTGKNGVRRWKRKSARPFSKGTFTTLFEDARYETLKSARTPVRVHQAFGNLVGSAVLISQRTSQITMVAPAPADVALSGQQISYESREPLAGTTDKTSSVLTLHFF